MRKQPIAMILVRLFLFVSLVQVAKSLSTPSMVLASKWENIATTRRSIFRDAGLGLLVGGGVSLVTGAASAADKEQRDAAILLQSPNDRVGLQLMDVTIGNPPRQVVAVRNVLSQSLDTRINDERQKVQAGMVLNGYSSAAQVVERLKTGPFPLELTFRNLAAGGDAISDQGTPMVTAQDALDLARKTSDGNTEAVTTAQASSSSSTTGYSVTQLTESSPCSIQSRRGDVLEIRYDAYLDTPNGDVGPNGAMYDSSDSRGTGQPYQMVLGSGDMLPGVDQGLYDMCPGDVRGLRIPPVLAYGSRGNKIFNIPPETSLYWKVELVSVNSVRKGDTRTRDEMEGRFKY